MNRITFRSRVDDEGVLRLILPVGASDANMEVQVTVEPLTQTAMTQEAWSEVIQRTAGSITDPSFIRHPQGDFEVRDPI